MKKFIDLLLVCLFTVTLALMADDAAAAEQMHPYDTEMRMVFGFGHGKNAVREEDFAKFVKEVVTPAFKDGVCMLDARGQWINPDRGLIREKNVVLFMEYVQDPEMEALQEQVAKDFLARFPGSNASVYMVRTPNITATVYY